MPNPKFHNPYGVRGADGTQLLTFTIRKDANVLRRIRPAPGTIDTVISILYEKLLRELKRRGITDWRGVERFEDFVVRCELCLPDAFVGGTTNSVGKEAETSAVVRGAKGGSAAVAKPASREDGTEAAE